MKQAIRTICLESRYPVVGCRVERLRASSVKKYRVKANSPKLFDALINARWRKPVHKQKQEEHVSLPEENVAAITLLDSWLAKKVQEPDDAWKRFERSLDENRFSNRRFFT